MRKLRLAAAPDVGFADEALSPADIEQAPAIVAIRKEANDAGFGAIGNAGAIIGAGTHGAGFSNDHARTAPRQQAHGHPALRAVRIFHQAPIFMHFDDFDRQIFAAIFPHHRHGFRRSLSHPRIIGCDGRPIRCFLGLLRSRTLPQRQCRSDEKTRKYCPFSDVAKSDDAHEGTNAIAAAARQGRHHVNL